jgi:hypothetical protein
MRNVRILSLFCLLALYLWSSSAEAILPKRQSKEPDASEKVRTYQPPPADSMRDYCEPYRKQASDLTYVSWWKKPFVIPQRNWAIHQHQKCTGNLMQQEWEYLRHADIQQPPSLPKLKVDDAVKTPGGDTHADRP